MEAPQLLLVPATPIYSKPHPLSPTSPIVDSKLHRSNSEAAIVSIYSMYGDEDDTNTWATAAFEPVERRSRKKAKRAGIVRPKDNRHLSPHESHNPLLRPPEPATHDDLYDSMQPEAPLSSPLLAALPIDCNHGRSTTTNMSSPPLDSRSNSVLSTSSQTTFETASVGRSSTESNRDLDQFANGPTNLITSAVTSPRSRSRSPRRRPPSALHKSVFAKRELPPVPIPNPLPSRTLTPSKTPSPPSLSSRNQSRTTSPSSKVSLAPSQGEDPDAFLVRSTYALLDEQGVRGDGYEEGVERTRAKIGASRACQLDAEQALGDPGEKSRELNDKEIETLASLDRYGFFTIPSHDRLVLLPSAPLRKRLSVSPPGSSDASTDATPLPSLPPAPLPSKETSRIGKWNRMIIPSARDVGGNIESWTIKPSKESKLRRRVYKGIPDRWRTAAWDLLMSRPARMDKFDLDKLGAEYRDALEKPSSYDVQIDLDVPRTISGHILFHTRYGFGQRSLFHVLHSFSLRCPDCGYVQGMGPIAATLLCYFDPERVYASLVRLHDAYDMHRIFSPGFPGLLEAIYVQERLTKVMMPEVYAAFGRHMVSTTAYATKWYITLFANSVPFQTQLRLWDAFLLEGPDVFVAMAVAIVWVYRDQITSRSANFETVLSLLSSFFVPQDENVLLSWIRKMLGDPKLRSSITLWRAEWKRLVARGEDSKVLL